MKLLPVATLLFVLLISACSDDPDKQSQSDPEAPANEAVAETTKPAQATETSKPAHLAEIAKPDQQPTTTNPAPLANTHQPTLAELMPKPEYDSENCVVDPVTGRVVCSTGLCALFNDLCPPGTPMGMAKIPFEIGYNIATTFGSSALTVARTGLEKTEAGTEVVNKATNIWSRIKRAIDALLSDPPEEFNTVKKSKNYSTQTLSDPKITYQPAK
ncbi:MAG: hypothetical protein GY753_03270 [Gammaproteobacteria bacterium]|nr:hypothetical protein [Gammaproteobacteria bacterium]